MTFLMAHTLMGRPDAPRTAFVLHGVLGSGQNFRGFVRRLSAATPDLNYVLVDLRNHGGSHPAPPPHTLASCAEDLERLAAHLGRTPTCVIGHSFGGKVALEFARSARNKPETLWVLDSDPGTQVATSEHETARVLAAVRRVPLPIQSRQAVVEALEAQGLSSGLANWMTTNIRKQGDGYAWSVALDEIEQLLADYFQRDLWPYLEMPKSAPQIHLVIAERSSRWTDAMRQRAFDIAPEARVRAYSLPDAGHWVHVDNPDGLFALMAPELARGG